jgi:lipopolysaccharide assembly outer membrane protein LptD (OstA)
MLTASGGVEYVKTEGDKVETFRGDSITVDIDNWSSIFLGGVSERSLQSDKNTTYLFAGTVISRDEEDVTVLNRASISSANNEESLWSLNATRVWLLPGSDFAIFNAVLKVGEIPVLYIPFFFYPADELIVHPVIGYRTREGNYVQTTTYILGRPQSTGNTQSSLTKILGSSNDMEKKREGMFLRSTGKMATDKNAVSLKAMVDYYANLGTYIGTDLKMPPKGILGDLNLSVGIGLTRTIYDDGRGYTPYYPDYDGSIDWNNSNLFSTEVPFRYRFKTDSSIRGKYGSFSWNIPYYSDPLIDSDFMNRAEEMDWINMLQKGSALDEEETIQNQLTSYVWTFSGQLNPSYPNMSPYINNISISGISSSVSFRTVDKRGTYSQSDIRRYSPTSFFYAPETSTLYSVSGSVTGAPLSIGGSTATSQASAKVDTTEPPDPLQDIGIPRSPFEDKVQEEAKKKEQSDILALPELTQRFDLPKAGNTRFSVDYRIAPSSASTLKFDYLKWDENKDINWGDVSSVLTNVGGDGSVNFNINHSETLFSNSFSLSGNGTWRQYSFLNEDAKEYLKADGSTDETKVANAKLNEYGQSSFSTSYNVSSTLRPLYRNEIFKTSSLTYSLRGLFARSKFNAADSTADDPQWDVIWGKWAKDGDKGTKEEGIQFINTHRMATNVAATIMDKTQTLALEADLPPLDSAITWRAGFNIWITQTTANMRISYPGESDRRKLEPFSLTEQINFGEYGNFSQTLILDTEDWDHSKEADELLREKMTTLTSKLNLTKWGLTASFSASRMLGDEYIPKGSDPDNPSFEGWRTRKGTAVAGDPNYTLKPKELSLNFGKTWSMKELWDNRLQFSVGTKSDLVFNLQKYTESRYTFSLNFTVGINKFIDLTMSAESRNNSIYRYFKDLPFFDDADIYIEDGPQNNLFLDLINSFRFDDEELRKLSGYKMSRFNIRATHYLGDWNAILSWSMSPYLPPASSGRKRQYEMDNQVTFLVEWKPISEFRTNVTYNKRNVPEWKVEGLGN